MAEHSSSLPSSDAINQLQAQISENRTWFIILGIAMIVLGAVAIGYPALTTIAAKLFLGWLLLIVGIAQVIHAFATKSWSEFFLNLLVGLLYIVVGGWLAFFPLTGILTLTVMLAALFIIEGVIEIMMAFRLRPLSGWGWMLFSGIMALVLGCMIFAQLPSSALWAIGLLVGINMITSGWAYVFIAQAAKKTG